MGAPCKMLIAEDETLVAKGLKAQLEDLGYEVVAVAADGRQAIELAERHRPDVVLMDIQMPEIDGLSAARRIFQARGIPVVVLSGYDEEALLDQASQTGVFGAVLKPATSQDLSNAIEAGLERFHAYREGLDQQG